MEVNWHCENHPHHASLYFGWGSAPDPAGGAYSTPQTPSWIIGGILLRQGEGKGGKRRILSTFFCGSTSMYELYWTKYEICIMTKTKISVYMMTQWQKDDDVIIHNFIFVVSGSHFEQIGLIITQYTVNITMQSDLITEC